MRRSKFIPSEYSLMSSQCIISCLSLHEMLRFLCMYCPYTQSELPSPIPRISVELDHGCTSRIYFDNAGDNVTLTLYNVTLMSQKPCQHNNKRYCSKTNGLNDVYVFFSIKYH